MANLLRILNINKPSVSRSFSFDGIDHNKKPCEVKITLTFPDLSAYKKSDHYFQHLIHISFEVAYIIDGQYVCRSMSKTSEVTELKQIFPQYSNADLEQLNNFLIYQSPLFLAKYDIGEKCLLINRVDRKVILPNQSFLSQCLTQCESIYQIEIIELYEIINRKAKKDILALKNNRNIYPSSPLLAQCYALGFYYPYIKDITRQGYDVRLSKSPLNEPYFQKV